MIARIYAIAAASLIWAISFGPALSAAGTDQGTGSDVIVVLFLCGLMGLVGQGARVIVGLKTLSNYKPSPDPTGQDEAKALFSLARLLTSLIIGFVAGVLAGLAYWKTQKSISDVKVADFDTLIKFAVAGYIGTDVIEAFTSKYFEASTTTTLKDAPPSASAIDLGPLSDKIDDLADKVANIGSKPAAAPNPTVASSDVADSTGPVTLASLVTHTARPPLLGSLSSKYEVGNRGPGTVSSGIGDPGGVSYGSYQMTSKANGQIGGTVKLFVAQLPADRRKAFNNLTPGDAAFSAAWRQLALADANGFFVLQHQFIQTTHYLPVCQSVANRVDINARTFALQNVVWSTAVQHGATTGIVASVAGRYDFKNETGPIQELDALIIKGIYAERGKRAPDGTLVHFQRSSPRVQASVAQRFVDEQRDALKMLASESADNAALAQSDEYTA